MLLLYAFSSSPARREAWSKHVADLLRLHRQQTIGQCKIREEVVTRLTKANVRGGEALTRSARYSARTYFDHHVLSTVVPLLPAAGRRRPALQRLATADMCGASPETRSDNAVTVRSPPIVAKAFRPVLRRGTPPSSAPLRLSPPPATFSPPFLELRIYCFDDDKDLRRRILPVMVFDWTFRFGCADPPVMLQEVLLPTTRRLRTRVP